MAANEVGITYSNLELQVIVYHYNNPPRSTYLGNDPITKQDISETITSWNYTKSIDNAAGAFEISLKPNADPTGAIRSGDWIQINYKKDQHEKFARCIGMIDRVSKSIQTLQDGRRNVKYKISGRDIGKVFSDMTVFLDKYTVSKSSLLSVGDAWRKLLSAKARNFSGSPDEVVKGLINQFLGNATGNWPTTLKQFYVPNELVSSVGKSPTERKAAKALNMAFAGLGDLFSPSKKSILSLLSLEGIQQNISGGAFKLDTVMQLIQSQANFWQILKSCQNPLMNEMFLELNKDGVPTFYFRVIPFIDDANKKYLSTWKKWKQKRETLPGVGIIDGQIINMDLGQSDHERYNYFFLQVNSGNENSSLFIPMDTHINETSIRRYGVKPHIKSADYAYLANFKSTGKEGKDFYDVVKEWNDFLYAIYNNNPYYESGTVIIKGNPEIRVGSNLVIEYDKKNKYSYYIEGYTDTWEIGEQGAPHYVTTVTVTRGYKLSDKSYINFEKEDKVIKGGVTFIKNKKGK